MNSKYNDMGAYIKSVMGIHVAAPIIAGTGTDDQDHDTDGFNFEGFGSAALLIGTSATIALSTEPLKVTVSIAESDSDSAYGDWAEILTSATLASATGTHMYQLNVDMTGYKHWAKFRINVDCIASSTDSIYMNINLVKGGAVSLPIS